MMFVYRFSHSGKVCSGDYLENKEAYYAYYTYLYLFKQGFFFSTLCWIQIVFYGGAILFFSLKYLGLLKRFNKD